MFISLFITAINRGGLGTSLEEKLLFRMYTWRYLRAILKYLNKFMNCICSMYTWSRYSYSFGGGVGGARGVGEGGGELVSKGLRMPPIHT